MDTKEIVRLLPELVSRWEQDFGESDNLERALTFRDAAGIQWRLGFSGAWQRPGEAGEEDWIPADPPPELEPEHPTPWNDLLRAAAARPTAGQVRLLHRLLTSWRGSGVCDRSNLLLANWGLLRRSQTALAPRNDGLGNSPGKQAGSPAGGKKWTAARRLLCLDVALILGLLLLLAFSLGLRLANAPAGVALQSPTASATTTAATTATATATTSLAPTATRPPHTATARLSASAAAQPAPTTTRPPTGPPPASPTPSPSSTPPATPTPSPAPTRTPTPTASPTPTATPSPTALPTDTPTATPTFTVTPTRPPATPAGPAATEPSGRIVFPLYDPASQPGVDGSRSRFTYRSWQADERGLFVRPITPGPDLALGGDIWRVTSSFEAARLALPWAGQEVVYSSSQVEDRQWRLYDANGLLLRADGADLLGQAPAWLPDGRLVFSHCQGSACGLYLMRLPSAALQQVTDSPDDTVPAVSPDGRWIAFASGRSGNLDLYLVPPEGGTPLQLTRHAAQDSLPAWSPDGKWIAFVSNREGGWAVWAITVDGTQERQLFSLENPPGGCPARAVSHECGGWQQERLVWLP
jgi:hypothetical protein